MGAAAGGLVRDGHTGLVFPAGDAASLALRLSALASSPALRARLGEQARTEAARLTPRAWAAGMGAALAVAGAGEDRRPC